MSQLLGATASQPSQLTNLPILEELGAMIERWSLVDPFVGNEQVVPWRYLFYYNVAAGALDELNQALQSTKRKRQALSSPSGAEQLAECALCWRFGARRRGGYYCPLHEPSKRNSAYKRALRLLRWQRKPYDQWFVFRVRGALARRYRAQFRREPAESLLSAVLQGHCVTARDFPRRRIDWSKYLVRLPYLTRYLSDQDVNLTSARAIVRALDPREDSLDEVGRIHRRLHAVFAWDQHQLWSMAVLAEAWLAGDARRRASWGGLRAVKAVESCQTSRRSAEYSTK